MNTNANDTKAGKTKNFKTLMDDLAIVILAAGKGTRMKSDLPKVLHRVGGKSMVMHVLACAGKLTQDHIYLVIGHKADLVKQEVSPYFSGNFVIQKRLLGTGDAVKQALPDLASGIKDVLVLCGDVPLIKESTLRDLLATHRNTHAKLTVLAVDMENPGGYGRIILDDSGDVAAIREEADATFQEKQITTINTGIYCFDRKFLEAAIGLLRPDNNQAEFYLTDMVEIARSKKEKISVRLMADPRQVIGVNSPHELERVESLIHAIENELP
jgi:bifunctional UDP-N-acetylglucosamine pyrophosphorylase/glucosamine-1-phosphate N-acetyltransferase/UDP-N-acetylglucosamine pyrophosphorylase